MPIHTCDIFGDFRCNFIGDFRCNFIGDFDGSSRKNCVCGQLLILFVPVAQVVGMPMGIVTAMATAIVVAVTWVKLCGSDTYEGNVVL